MTDSPTSDASATSGKIACEVSAGLGNRHRSLQWHRSATRFLQDNGSQSALSVITRAETLAGFTDQTEQLALELLDNFPTLPITRDIADFAARLRRTERWKLPDAFQAAVAMHHELTLITRNSRDFQEGEALRVLAPYRG